MGSGNLDPANLGGAALHDRCGVLDALVLQVRHDLEVGDGPRAGLPRQWLHVIEVVEVAVGNQDGVEFTDLLQFLGGMRVVRQERVYDYLLVARRHESKRRVTEVGDPGSA